MMPKLDSSNLGNLHEYRGFRKIITIVRLDAAAFWVILVFGREKKTKDFKKKVSVLGKKVSVPKLKKEEQNA